MIKAETFKGQNIAVFGLGRTGVSAALSLQAGGAMVSAWDDRSAGRDEAAKAGVSIVDLTAADWDAFDALVLSPGVPDNLPKPHWSAERAKASNTPIICDIEIFAREVAARPEAARPKIVAITGTNGKSTTTSLIGHILKACGKDAQIGGNIGRGVLDLDRMHAGTYYVIELSSYQLERTQSLRANAAVFLNLSPDHLDRHGTLEDYGLAKQNIFANQTDADTVVIGVDDDYGTELCSMLKAKNGRRIVPISARRSLGHGVSVLDGTLHSNLGKRAMKVCDLRKAKTLEGLHNWQNAAAAFAAVQSLGLPDKAIGDAIQSFPGLAHRMETIGQVGKVRFVNDSKATNADAARQALASYDNIYWIAGGVEKEGGITPLLDLMPRVSKAYLVGKSAPKFSKVLKKASVNFKVSGQLDMAVMCAARDALQSDQPNPIVLLSPACASFDQFKDFERRGQAFRESVETLIRLFEAEKAKKANTESAA
ncbi:UDP-N-acetylmuramoyl-L-alanine--D-glutamate ligase [Litorimonas sp. RW-G-Af-16]|uniref:UDP-N-acetylmuramoyl-L-alanine--D-glutamate ligase n=1 Tax=Litorimonas sp. RW-G-Af-16 TaxID=3241168 RepID=UPI00390C8706